MADTFKKVFTDQDGTYYILYLPEIGKAKRIDESKPVYQEWLEAANVPEEVPFVPVTEVERSVEELRRVAYWDRVPMDAAIEGFFEHILEGRPEKLAALQAVRQQIKEEIA